MDLYKELLGIVNALNEGGIEYALCGGMAVGIYGYPRFTKDIDILIAEEALETTLSVIRKIGFTVDSGYITFQTGAPQEQTVFRVLKVEGEDFLTLDLILTSLVLESVWQDREVVEWDGRQVKIVSRDGLTTMKKIAGRDQDLLDLKKLRLTEDEE